MTPLFTLTVLQLAGGKRIWVVVVLSAIPLLAGLAFRFASPLTDEACHRLGLPTDALDIDLEIPQE